MPRLDRKVAKIFFKGIIISRESARKKGKKGRKRETMYRTKRQWNKATFAFSRINFTRINKIVLNHRPN